VDGEQVAVALAAVGATLGVVMVVPQVVRIVRHPHLGGVSPVSWSLTALGCSVWLTYGLRTWTVPQIPGNVLLVAGAALVVLLVPSAVSRARRALNLGVVAAGLLAVAMTMPARDVGYLAFCLGLCSSWPQVAESVATWRAGRSSGVSVPTWVLKAGSQVCWLGYGLGAHDVPVLVSSTVALSTSVLLVGLETTAARRAATAALAAVERVEVLVEPA
jgi:uncharacterized protein with PQ loop repeat